MTEAQGSAAVLLSIKPRFANAILEGTKLFEFRRVTFRAPGVRKVVIYASSPIRLVIGEFMIDETFALEPRKLWALTEKGAGEERDFFDKYFRGCAIGFALKVQCPRRYPEPLPLEHFGLSRPPQSFYYLRDVAVNTAV